MVSVHAGAALCNRLRVFRCVLLLADIGYRIADRSDNAYLAVVGSGTRFDPDPVMLRYGCDSTTGRYGITPSTSTSEYDASATISCNW